MENEVFQGEELYALIPQRPPIVMVDLLKNITAEDADTGLMIKKDNIFLQNGVMQEPGLIEHIAQSAAAFAGYETYISKEEPKLGYIGEIKKMRMYTLPQVGSTLKTHLHIIGTAVGITLLEAQTYIGDTIVAEGQMKIFIKEN